MITSVSVVILSLFTVKHFERPFKKIANNIESLMLNDVVDYELPADVKNGLDVIEELNLNKRAILVSSCFEDIAIRERCENIGVKIIPLPDAMIQKY